MSATETFKLCWKTLSLFIGFCSGHTRVVLGRRGGPVTFHRSEVGALDRSTLSSRVSFSIGASGGHRGVSCLVRGARGAVGPPLALRNGLRGSEKQVWEDKSCTFSSFPLLSAELVTRCSNKSFHDRRSDEITLSSLMTLLESSEFSAFPNMLEKHKKLNDKKIQ